MVGDASAGHIENMGAESGPIYALGPLGPFFVAASSGSSAALSSKDSLVAIGCSDGGNLMRGNGAAAHDVMVNATEDRSMASEAQEIVTPPVVASSEELLALKKQTDERFKRKSKNLPCTVAGALEIRGKFPIYLLFHLFVPMVIPSTMQS